MTSFHMSSIWHMVSLTGLCTCWQGKKNYLVPTTNVKKVSIQLWPSYLMQWWGACLESESARPDSSNFLLHYAQWQEHSWER